MALPEYRGKGSSNSGTGSTNPGLPAGLEVSDLLIHFVESAGTVAEGEAVNTPTAEAGWTQLLTEKTGNTRLTVFWQIAATTTPVHKVSGTEVNHLISNIIAIKKGTFNEAEPFHKTAVATQAKTKSVSYPTVTTTQAECLVVNLGCAALPDANSETEFGEPTNASLGSLNERIDNSTAEGDGGAIHLVTGTKAVAGAVSATTCTAVTESVRAVVTLAIAPPSTTVNVTAPTASATATALVPTLSAGATLEAPTANGTAAAIVPTINADATVTVPTSTGTASAIAPTISTELGAIIEAPTAAAVSAAVVPTVEATQNPTVIAVTATATVSAVEAQVTATSIHVPPAIAKPSVTHAISITSRDGTVTRFGADEEALRRLLISGTFDTSLPGGFQSGAFTVPRPSKFETSAAKDFQSLRFYIAETNETLYAGRVTGTPQVDDTTINIECEGWITHLEDDKSAREIFVDRDISKFGEMSTQRQINVVLAGYNYNGTTTTSERRIKQDFTRLASPPFAITETIYYGNGVSLGKVRYDTWINAGIASGDANWNMEAFLSNDPLISVYNTSGDFNATAVAGNVLNATATGRKYLGLQCSYAGTFTGDGAWSWSWNNVCVMGLHGLTERGAWPETGLYVSDMVPYLIGKFAPLLEYTTGTGGTIEPTSFIVKQAAWSDYTTAASMITELAAYGGSALYAQDYGCYGDTGREFFLRQPGSYGRTWVINKEQSGDEDSSAGPDSSQYLNGCLVTYDESGTGNKKSVGPPGSGSDTEVSALADTDPANPANNDGARHWDVIDIGVGDRTAAELVGQLTLNTRNNQEWRGDIVLRDTVEDQAGNSFPVGMVRAGDEIVVADDEDTKARRIVSTSYAPHEVTASIGARPDQIAAFLARIANNEQFQGV